MRESGNVACDSIHHPNRSQEVRMAHVLWLDDYTQTDRPVLGGKNASLGEMTSAGLPVPPGFAVTSDAYKSVLGSAGLVAELADAIGRADVNDAEALAAAAGRARELVTGAAMPDELANAICEAYWDLCRRCESDDVPVAVRSSATCEDQPDASFAGEHDTYLWIHGTDAVLEHLRRCWASLYTDRAVAYRWKMGYAEDSAAMSVGVQKMVTPRAAGVAFTLNPHNGDRSQVAIDASWGFGEAVVSGEVTPDNFVVDKVTRAVTSRTISTKRIEYAVDGCNAVIKVDVEEERRDAPCLSDAEIVAVAALARRAEQHYGCPQDVEWALDAQLPEGENVLLLQSRPETVWSNRPRASVATGGNYMNSIVNTLVSPLHQKGS
jgi:pyruvate,water dikinase